MADQADPEAGGACTDLSFCQFECAFRASPTSLCAETPQRVNLELPQAPPDRLRMHGVCSVKLIKHRFSHFCSGPQHHFLGIPPASAAHALANRPAPAATMSLAEDRGPASPGRDDPRQSLHHQSMSDDEDLLSLDGSLDRARKGGASCGRCGLASLAALPALAILLVTCAALAHTFKLVAFAGNVQDLEADQEFDVLIIGAGAAGLAAAKQLREQTALKVRHPRRSSAPLFLTDSHRLEEIGRQQV